MLLFSGGSVGYYNLCIGPIDFWLHCRRYKKLKKSHDKRCAAANAG
jgi:hypothetical protein